MLNRYGKAFKSLVGTVLIVCGCARQSQPVSEAVTQSQGFVYEQRIGIASTRGAEAGCLAVYNPSLIAGVKVTLIDQPDATQSTEPAGVQEAAVVERLSQPCDDHMGMGDRDCSNLSFYKIQLVTKPWPYYTSVVAIIDPSGPITVRAGKAEADLDGDGTNESFRTCSSSEGVHHQVWSGLPLLGRPRWHWCVYAGYDTE